MANLPSIKKKIQVEEVQFRAPMSESMIQKIGGSINWILDNAQGVAIGSFDGSFLSEAQYQAINGAGFIIADGRNVVGSAYNAITGFTTVPDARGAYLRMKDHGAGINPDGDTALGTVQAGGNLSHNHGVNFTNPSVPPFIDRVGVLNPNLICDTGPLEGVDPSNPSTIIFSISAQGAGSGEATHVKMNWFIRIN